MQLNSTEISELIKKTHRSIWRGERSPVIQGTNCFCKRRDYSYSWLKRCDARRNDRLTRQPLRNGTYLERDSVGAVVMGSLRRFSGRYGSTMYWPYSWSTSWSWFIRSCGKHTWSTNRWQRRNWKRWFLSLLKSLHQVLSIVICWSACTNRL